MNRIASHKIAWTTFVANIIILMFHANLKNYFTDMTGTFADYVMDFFSALAIPMMTYFFFISAFLFFRNFDMSKLKGKLKTRINSILIPYVIWNTFSIILQLIKGTPILVGGKDGYPS